MVNVLVTKIKVRGEVILLEWVGRKEGRRLNIGLLLCRVISRYNTSDVSRELFPEQGCMK